MKRYLIISALIIFVVLLTTGCAQDIKQTKADDQYETIKLFYYNREKDREIDESIPCSPDAVLPVERKIIKSDIAIDETLKLLLKGDLKQEEIDAGFETEFPHPTFRIKNLNLRDGVLKIEFDDPDGFTIGGSCRVGLLYTQIEKTATQFDNINSITVTPEELFQP